MRLTEYTTIRAACGAEYTEKKSRFLAFLHPVENDAQVSAFFEETRRAHPDARHHVTAVVLPDTQRCSDDGEPSGTAGQPVLNVLQRRGFCRVAAVVVRYFGGVLLGAPGLVRAYGRAASLAAGAAEPLCMRACTLFALSCGYPALAGLERLCRAMGDVQEIDYAEAACIRAAVPTENATAFTRAVAEQTAGRVPPQELGALFVEASRFG